MRQIILSSLVVFLILTLTGCNGSVVSDTPITGESPGSKDYDSAERVIIALEGIGFQFDASLADSTDLVIVPASGEGSMLPYPKHLQITFNIPAKANHTVARGYLSLYSIDQFRQVDHEAGKIIDTLIDMLADKKIEKPGWEMPFLPFINAGQLFHSNVRIISFKNGQGIRYISQHVQDISPILNDSLIYTFQGITADDLYYVSLVMPVGHNGLASNWEEFFTEIDYDEFADEFETYLERDRALLSNSPDSGFKPSLDLLDRLVESILIESPVIILEGNEDTER